MDAHELDAIRARYAERRALEAEYSRLGELYPHQDRATYEREEEIEAELARGFSDLEVKALLSELDRLQIALDYASTSGQTWIDLAKAQQAQLDRLARIEAAAGEVVGHIRDLRTNRHGERVISVMIGGTEFGYTDSADPEWPGYPLLRDMLKLHDTLEGAGE